MVRSPARVRWAVLALAWAAPAAAFDPARAACVIDVAADKLLATDARLLPGAYPEATAADGRWRTRDAADQAASTQGFFPGSMWLLHSAKGEEKWAARARAWTAPLAVARTSADAAAGFRLVPSFGAMELSTGDAAARQVLLDGAASLATRRVPAVDAIPCCAASPDGRVRVVVDTLVSLQLLFWSAANGGPASHAEIALSHALLAARDLVREDGGTFELADYAADGALLSRGTIHGAGDASTWARGQGWAMLGFSSAYLATRDPRMLAAARQVTAYWLTHAPADGVSSWDLDAPGELKDTSAAAIAASALLDLAALVEGDEAARYREAALRTLDTLSSDAWLDRTHSEALLRGGVGNGRTGEDVGAGLVHGDYFLIRATLRAEPRPSTCATAGSPASPLEPGPVAAPPVATPRRSGGGCSTAGGGGALALAAGLAGLLAARRGSKERPS
jgi:unsaturated chondroitin disaccharide hydrolase